uniref:GRAM domain-containing protein n=1 Tax=Macrostomum lignano TaxID=282301 RepID=A0A1I8JQP5_9PLAT
TRIRQPDIAAEVKPTGKKESRLKFEKRFSRAGSDGSAHMNGTERGNSTACSGHCHNRGSERNKLRALQPEGSLGSPCMKATGNGVTPATAAHCTPGQAELLSVRSLKAEILLQGTFYVSANFFCFYARVWPTEEDA